MASFFHVWVSPKQGISQEEVEKKMNLCLDWFRCGEGVYVVYSKSEPDKLFLRFKPLIDDEGLMFICRLSEPLVYNGWMPEEFWEWLRKDRDNA